MAENNVFRSASSKQSNWMRVNRIPLIVVAWYFLGVLHWYVFLNGGQLDYAHSDWYRQQYYFIAIQNAVRTMKIPYHLSLSIQNTDQFFSNPEVILSPQIFLLAFLTVKQFIMFNVMLMYSIGFIGCLLIRRHYRLGAYSFSALFLLFHFNGYITSHISVVHGGWFGYFFLPFFVFYLLQFIEQDKFSLSILLKMSLVLFGIGMQGGYHIYIWSLIFLLLLVIGNIKFLKPVLYVVISSFLLLAVRLIPAQFVNWPRPEYVGGYPNWQTLWSALVDIKLHSAIVETMWSYKWKYPLSWWEVDAFISIIGVGFLLYFGIYPYVKRWRDLEDHRFASLLFPLCGLFFLSMVDFWRIFTLFPIPYLQVVMQSQRLPTRFIVLPLVVLSTIAVIYFEGWLKTVSQIKSMKSLLNALLILWTLFMLNHSYAWRMYVLEFDMGVHKIEDVQLIDKINLSYINAFNISFLVSAISFIFFLVSIFLLSRKEKRTIM